MMTATAVGLSVHFIKTSRAAAAGVLRTFGADV
jgi:hypothetical protein